MISVRMTRGYHLNIQGNPAPELAQLPPPSRVAVVPERIPFVKPRLLVAKNEPVAIGSPLFEDKKNPRIKFLSPGGGQVADIIYGPRRVVRAMVIACETDEARVEFERFGAEELAVASSQNLIAALCQGGLWPLLRELPFRSIPDPDRPPPAIYVSLGALEPFQPQPAVYLHNNRAAFKLGLTALKKLSPNRVVVFAPHASNGRNEPLVDDITHTVTGPYPADDAGVLLYHLKKGPAENRAWYIRGQDVVLLGRLLETGRYPTQRIVAVGGSAAVTCGHFRTRLGVPLAHLASHVAGDPTVRCIQGGVFSGYRSDWDSYLGFHETALTLIPEGFERTLLAFVRPGIDRPSYSRAFLSTLFRRDLAMNANLRGEERACIGCGHCTQVCPVDILPQFAYKAVVAEDVEESLAHGLLDCVECGLCSYVCPSKIELMRTFKNAKAAYRKEQAEP